MRRSLGFTRLIPVLCVLALNAIVAAQPTPLDDTFTFQGVLREGGVPAEGGYDFECLLFDRAVGGNQVGLLLVAPNVDVVNGVFTIDLDFGIGAFNGSNRFLELRVRPTGAGVYTPLLPRQPIFAAPYSLFAKTASISGTYGNQVSFTNASNAFTGNGSGLTQLNAGNVATGNLSALRMPTGGTWSPSSLLNVDSGTLALDPTLNRVGIGTTTPQSLLEVASTSTFATIIGADTGTGSAGRFVGPDNNGSTSAFRVESGSQILLMDGNEIDSLDEGGLFLNFNVDSDVLLASGGGHVGIGNTTPVASLTVGSPSVLNVFASGDSTCFDAQAGPGCSDPGCENLVCAVDAFCCNSAWDSVCVGEANTLCIGRVGIGTEKAEAKLHVAGGTDSTGGGGGFIVIGSTTGPNMSIDNNEIMARNNGVAAALAINADGGNVNILQNAGGNVGVGTTSPSALVHVVGSVNADRGALYRVQNAGSSGGAGVFGLSTVSSGNGVIGEANTGTNPFGVWGMSTTGEAGHFSGDVDVVGALSKDSGSFKIDHPLDPANMYLYHSFVESPDMMNIYNGVALTDDLGYATITLPVWFETLNSDHRYQLTVIDEADSDEFVMAKVVSKIAGNQFTIRTSAAFVEVSWQVTGIRQDAWAQANRIQVEVEKPAHERGFYRHPELYGQPPSKKIEEAARPGSFSGKAIRDRGSLTVKTSRRTRDEHSIPFKIGMDQFGSARLAAHNRHVLVRRTSRRSVRCALVHD
jgi:hypothetical protein